MSHEHDFSFRDKDGLSYTYLFVIAVGPSPIGGENYAALVNFIQSRASEKVASHYEDEEGISTQYIDQLFEMWRRLTEGGSNLTAARNSTESHVKRLQREMDELFSRLAVAKGMEEHANIQIADPSDTIWLQFRNFSGYLYCLD